VRKEAAIEVNEAKEALELFDSGRGGVVLNGGVVGVERKESSGRNGMAQVSGSGLSKR
jgi:hypothetical protein